MEKLKSPLWPLAGLLLGALFVLNGVWALVDVRDGVDAPTLLRVLTIASAFAIGLALILGALWLRDRQKRAHL